MAGIRKPSPLRAFGIPNAMLADSGMAGSGDWYAGVDIHVRMIKWQVRKMDGQPGCADRGRHCEPWHTQNPRVYWFSRNYSKRLRIDTPCLVADGDLLNSRR